jgi:hypothetical protein
MSADWGVLGADPAFRLDGDGRESPEPAEAPGRWQEELDVGSYAEGSMTLPGQGDEGPNCGTWKPADFCDECAEVGYAPNRCERRSCPNCVGEWTRQRAVGATVRLQAARHTEPKDMSRRLVHVAVSPPEGSVTTLQEVYDGYGEAYELAKQQGVRGGVAVFHGFRVKEWVKQEFRECDPDMGVWRWLLNERSEGWRTLTYWSPHWHIIGLCRDLDEDRPDEQGGWVVRRMPTSFAPMESLNDRESYSDVVGAIRYLMSHASFESGTSRDCVRWFGELATTKFSAKEELSDGAYATVERIAKEVVGPGDDREGDGGAGDDVDPCEECGAKSRSPIWEAGAAMADPGWCDRIGRERERALNAAFEWAIGERRPPPGLKNPRDREQAEEAHMALVDA